MEKILTIVVPTYNMEKYLDRCLSSLIVDVARMELLEVLVVNDGSKDRSSEIAHLYENRFPNTFKVIDKVNGNYGSCINCGLKQAAGKYVKVLDADDYFDNNAFVEYISFLSSADVDFVFNGMSMVDETGAALGKYCFEDRLGASKTLPFNEYAKIMSGAGVYMQNVAYRLDCLKSINYHQTEGISYTDQEWLFVPLFTVNTVAYYPQSLYMYLVGRAGQTVDEETHLRNMWMEINVTKSIVKTYVSYKDEIEQADILQYVFGRMMARIRFIYSTYLLSACERLNINELIEFDNFLQSVDPETYNKSNNIVGRFGIKYVRIWRRKFGESILYYLLSLCHRFTKKNANV